MLDRSGFSDAEVKLVKTDEYSSVLTIKISNYKGELDNKTITGY